MSGIERLLANNRAWSDRMERERPGFFRTLADQQRPRYLWIGCADSRVPANQIIGLDPGEVFVHRNVANLVVHSDLNCLSVLDFAVNGLGIEDIIVCGHYRCGGVDAAMRPYRGGIADHWVRHVRDIARTHHAVLAREVTPEGKARRLCEVNVAVQVAHVRESPVLLAAPNVQVHGWIYDVADGLLRDVTHTVDELR